MIHFSGSPRDCIMTALHYSLLSLGGLLNRFHWIMREGGFSWFIIHYSEVPIRNNAEIRWLSIIHYPRGVVRIMGRSNNAEFWALFIIHYPEGVVRIMNDTDDRRSGPPEVCCTMCERVHQLIKALGFWITAWWETRNVYTFNPQTKPHSSES